MPTSAPIRIPWLVGGSVLSVAVLGFGTLNAVGLLAHQTEHKHIVISTPIRSLDVRSGGGTVKVVGTTDSTVTVDATISRGLVSPTHVEAVEGNRLVLRSKCSSFVNTWCGVSYTIRIPRGISVAVNTSGAGITVTDTTGDLDLSSSGGGITVMGGGGSERLDSSGGGIDATGLSATTVNASSSGGGVDLSFIAPPSAVTADSSGGGVAIAVPNTPGAYRVEVSASGGGTHTGIRIDPASARSIKADSSGGGVSVEYSTSAAQ